MTRSLFFTRINFRELAIFLVRKLYQSRIKIKKKLKEFVEL